MTTGAVRLGETTTAENPAATSKACAASFLSGPAPAPGGEGLLHQLFEESARLSGPRPAVECAGQTLSYQELDALSNQFARYLQAQGIGRGARVLLLFHKSLELYAAMLGILKAGAAYVPLDPSYPEERIRFIAQDSGAAALITSLDFLDLAGAIETRKIFFGEVKREVLLEPAGPLGAQAGPGEDAYVIYTSGTTGKPKGVLIAHENARRLILAEQQVYAIRGEDRVLQGFSTAFDASVEEIWCAFNAGATLVAGTNEVMHAGPELGRLLSELRITVLSCVPTLLSMFAEPVGSVRLLILGGEALSYKLVEAWLAPGRRVYNTYGPTETTVVATMSLCAPGRKVTIGRPIAGYAAHVRAASGALAPAGQEGELVIGGTGVAKGYLNRPELTAQRFIDNPWTALTGDRSRVLYRTGDLVRLNADGELEYLGRIDDQVKIRGFRVELGEIEALLLGLPGVRNAAAALRSQDGLDVLGAYVTIADGSFDEAGALAKLKQELPPYMVPSFIEPLRDFPTLASGKIDRRALPVPARRTARSPRREYDSSVKQAIHDRWARLTGNEDIGEEDNFFSDLGGHSLLAARLVSEMRRDARFARLSMRDVYAHPTIGRLARFIESAAAPKPSAPAAAAFCRVGARGYVLSACLQAAMLYVVMGIFALQWLTPFLVYSFFKAYEWTFWHSLLASVSSLCFVYPAMLFMGIAAKWLILGRLKEGDYPLWGAYYLRWLFVQRLLGTVPIHYLAGTPLMGGYLRLLGSRVGRDAYIDSHLISGLDLLEIGERASINADANISCHAVEDGCLKIRKVRIGADASVGVRSVVEQGVELGDGAVLADLSCVAFGLRVPAGEYWSGSPAARTARPETPEGGPTSGAGVPDEIGRLFYAASFFVLPTLSLLPVFPGIMLMYEMDYRTENYVYLLAAPLIALIFVLLSALQTTALKWLILGRMEEGRHGIKSVFYMRKWFVDKLIETSLDLLRTLYATLYLNAWYRTLGVKVADRAEISTAYPILPDLLEVGEGSFVADGAGLGPAEVWGGNIILKKTVVGSRTFIGNSAYVPAGSRLGRNCLLGVQSTVPGPETPDGTAWVGSPAVNLPARQKSEKQFAEERTYHPTRALYAQRLFIEFFRVILPSTFFVVFTTLILSFTVQIEDAHGATAAVLAFPLVYIGLGAASCLFTAAMKWTIVGRYKPGEHPLWSHFVWRNELVTGFIENFAEELFVQHLEGTAFLPWFFRLLGMRIGRRVCLLSMDFTEFDLVSIGDDAALNEDCTIQTHLFEDRVMKIGKVEIGARVSIGSYAVVLYDTVIEPDVKIGDLSLVMKGERLYAGSRWAGSPVASRSEQ